jgi:CheY-like chemotaxis protein
MSTILVVDDLPATRDRIASALRTEGHKVVCASTGQEALAAVRQEMPHLVLLDVRMPEMGGVAFLRQLRLLPAARHVPVILLTAPGAHGDALKATPYGVHGYLPKSRLSPDQLLACVRQNLTATPRSRPKAA